MAKKVQATPMDRFRLAQAKYDKLIKMWETLEEMTSNLEQDIDFRYDNTDGSATVEKVDSDNNETETAEQLLLKLTTLVEAEMDFQQRAAKKAADDLKREDRK